MRTEIVIPFAFDTSVMENYLQEQGMSEVHKILEEMVEKNVVSQLPRKTRYGWKNNNDNGTDWDAFLKDKFYKWLSEHQQEIIDEAAVLMAMRANTTKRWREVLAEYREADDED